jgi:A/G-specific adenine glycosylase
MLQQTTVTAVVPYFERFLERFPTLAALAAAREEEVLRQWEGLGYYSRARNIHRAARLLVKERDGKFPDEMAALLELPGIGRYTAGAIASFAFDRPEPILEANTLRLYCRLLGFRGDPRSAAGQKLLWDFAGRIVPRKFPGLFNQALMELGATICAPQDPRCPECPVRRSCAACTNGWQTQIPVRAARPVPTGVTEIAVAVHRGGSYLMRRRPAGEWWAGLWDFVRFAWDDGRRQSLAEIAGAVHRHAGIEVSIAGRIAEIHHSVTRFRITLCCYAAEWTAGEINRSIREFRWVPPRKFATLPLSATGRKLACIVQGRRS